MISCHERAHHLLSGLIAVAISVPLVTGAAEAAPSSDLVTRTDDTGTFALTTPATWDEVWSDPAVDEAGALYPRIGAAPTGGMADYTAPGVMLSSWPGSPAATPDPANIGRAVPEGCAEAVAVGPAPLPTLPNGIAGVWRCANSTFTSLQGNTADGNYLVAVTLRTPLDDEALRVTILNSLTYTGGGTPAELPPVETAGLVIENAGDPATAVRLRVGRQVDQGATTTHDVSLSMTGVATNEGMGQQISQDRAQSLHLVGSVVTRTAETDGSYTVAVTPTEITDRTETPDGVVVDRFAPLAGTAFDRRFGPDGLFVVAEIAAEAPNDTAMDDLTSLISQLPVESISLPASPVGVGATWTAPATFTVLPVTGIAPAHYRLDAIAGDRFTVTVTMDVDLSTIERDAFTESNSGRFTRSMSIEGSLTNAADLAITRNESAQLTNTEAVTGTVYVVDWTLTATSVDVPA